MDSVITYIPFDTYQESLLHMCINCYLDVYEQEEHCTIEEVRYNLESDLNCTNSIGVLALKNKQCIGFVIGNLYYVNNKMFTNLKEICVIKSERKQSIGSRMLEHFEALSKKHGSYCVCLEHNNTEAINDFYEKNNYYIPGERTVRNKLL